MPLLPRRQFRLFAGGGQLGYESQLGSGATSTGGAAGKVGDALYQNLPPLAVPYVPVRQAAPVNAGAAFAAADADGQKQADALLKDLEKKLAETLKDGRMTASGAAEWSGASNALLQKIYTDVSRNPAVFANPTYRTQLALDTNKLLDPGQFNSKRNTYDDYGNLRTSAKQQLNDRAVINGVRQVATNDQLIGEGLSNRDLSGRMQMLGLLPGQLDTQELRKLQGVDFSGHLLDKIKGGIQEGSFDDTQQVIKDWRSAIHTSESGGSSKSDHIGTIATGGAGAASEQRILSKGDSSFTTTNGPRIAELRNKIQHGGWQAALGNPKAVAGMYKAMNDRVDGTALRSDVQLADGTVLPAGTNRYTAEQEAYKRGDQAQYRYLMGKREQLVQERAIDYLNQELQLGLVNGSKTSSESGIGGEVGKPDTSVEKAQALAYQGRLSVLDPTLDLHQVSVPSVQNAQEVVPAYVSRMPDGDHKEEVLNSLTIDTGDGKSTRRKTLAEITSGSGSVLAAPDGSPLKIGEAWQNQGGARFDPSKFEVIGYNHDLVIPKREYSDLVKAKQRAIEANETRLQAGKISPAQVDFIHKQNTLLRKEVGALSDIYTSYTVSADRNAFKDLAPLLSYYSKESKRLVNPFDGSDPRQDNPYGLERVQTGWYGMGASSDAAYGGNHFLTPNDGMKMRVLVKKENAALSDNETYSTKYNMAGDAKADINLEKAKFHDAASQRPLH